MQSISGERSAAVKAVAQMVLAPLTRPNCLETLRLIRDSGADGVTKQEIESAFSVDQLPHVDPLLRDLVQIRAISRSPDRNDGRMTRYHPTFHTPRMLAIGDSLMAWIAKGPLDPGTELSAKAAKVPLRLATQLWVEGILFPLHLRPMTVSDLADSMGMTPTKARHIVDRAAEQGLLRKEQGPGGQKFVSTAPFFSSLVPTAARATVYMARAYEQSPACFSDQDLQVAVGELVKAITLERPLDATVGLSVRDARQSLDVTLVATFEQGVLVEHSPDGFFTAMIESDVNGWLRLLADLDLSQVNWEGRGARAVLAAIQDLAEV